MKIKGVCKKKAQILGLSFNMIFSIILIIAFVIATFYVIRYFLTQQQCTMIGEAYNKLQREVEVIWNSEGASKTIQINLPTAIEYLCFINYSKSMKNADTKTSQIYNELKVYKAVEANVFAYPIKKACPSFRYFFIKHVDFSNNPKCYRNVEGKVNIRLTRDIQEAFVNAE